MAVGAVSLELVSAAEFPDEQGKYREFSRFRLLPARAELSNCAKWLNDSESIASNSLVPEQGIFLSEQGIDAGDQGMGATT